MFIGYTKSNFFARIAFFFFYLVLIPFLWLKSISALHSHPEASLGLIVITFIAVLLAVKNIYGIIVLYRLIYGSKRSA